MNTMFCFQCEQTARGCGCTMKQGVCGKSSETAGAQDYLTGVLITLARSGIADSGAYDALIEDALFTTVTNTNFDAPTVNILTEQLIVIAHGTTPYDMRQIWDAPEDLRSAKSILLFGLRGMAAYAHHARILKKTDPTINSFMIKALKALSEETDINILIGLSLELGTINLTCMKLLDTANTSTYGAPVPCTVPLDVEPGPFIIVTGHDLYALEQLLIQTQDKGVSIYTHGEMLPAHGYPALKAYPHLKGNFGTAWQNQQHEFAAVPAPILYTTNCIMPVKESYADRIFTTSIVHYPKMKSIASTHDFTPIIEQAIELGGYSELHLGTGINGGSTVTTGFGNTTLQTNAPVILEAVNSGAVKHIFLVGGCDGAKPGRNYYTQFVKATPPDTLILTLACGKYRFNDLDLGTIGPFPRIIDIGQCNDAYSAIMIATTLAKACNVSVNELPLSFVLSWYEQKAVCILLTLLSLNIKGIFLGPTLPAFISPMILQVLIDTYEIRPTTTPEDDLAACLNPAT